MTDHVIDNVTNHDETLPETVSTRDRTPMMSFEPTVFESVRLSPDHPMPVGIQSFMQQYSTDWGSLMASAALAMVPTLILFLFIQKYMIFGATAGAVKG